MKGKTSLNQEAKDMVEAKHVRNERMFDSTSALYQTNSWFERSIRSPYAYAITRRRLLELLRLTGREDVLEIGCGPGTWTRVIASQARSVTAVDISHEMIVKAREFVRPYQVDFIHDDILHFIPTRSFDRVATLRAIEYVADLTGLVKRLGNLVAEGGELVVVTKTPFSVWRGRRFVGSLGHRVRHLLRPVRIPAGSDAPNNDPFYMGYVSPRDLVCRLHNIGFDDVTVYPVIVGLPILAGVAGDVPLVPGPLRPALLRFFNRLGDWFVNTPQAGMGLTLWLSESYAVRARKRKAI